MFVSKTANEGSTIQFGKFLETISADDEEERLEIGESDQKNSFDFLVSEIIPLGGQLKTMFPFIFDEATMLLSPPNGLCISMYRTLRRVLVRIKAVSKIAAIFMGTKSSVKEFNEFSADDSARLACLIPERALFLIKPFIFSHNVDIHVPEEVTIDYQEIMNPFLSSRSRSYILAVNTKDAVEISDSKLRNDKNKTNPCANVLHNWSKFIF